MNNIKIETDKLIIRDLEIKDFGDFSRLNIFSSKSNGFLDTQYYFCKIIHEQYFQPRKSFCLALFDKRNGFCGVCSLDILDNSILMEKTLQEEAQLRLLLLDNVSKSYGVEAVLAVLKYGFAELKLKRVFSLVDVNDINQQKLLKESKFRQEGLLQEYLFYEGSWHDQLQYAVLDDDFNL